MNSHLAQRVSEDLIFTFFAKSKQEGTEATERGENLHLIFLKPLIPTISRQNSIKLRFPGYLAQIFMEL